MAAREQKLYEVVFNGDTSSDDWKVFFVNAQERNVQTGGHRGFSTAGVVAAYASAQDLKMALTHGMEDRAQVTVTPITRESLEGDHRHWHRAVRYFKSVKLD